MNTPAQIIRRILIAMGNVPESQTADWSPFYSFMPDKPDSALVVYDTAGTVDGRLMRGGEKIEHPGIQVRVRGINYVDTWNKAKEIASMFDGFEPRTIVEMPATSAQDAESWLIQNISRQGTVLNMGMETANDRRWFNFTINAILTLRDATESDYQDYLVISQYNPGFYQNYQVLAE